MFGFKIEVIIIGTIILLGMLGGYYYSWKSGIEQQALMEFNRQQVEQTAKNQQDFKEKLDVINRTQTDILQQNEEKIKQLQDKIDDLSSYLDSSQAAKDNREASPILKNTIKKLRGTL